MKRSSDQAPGSDRDWTEDFALENGNYYNECLTCGRTFMGHKRRARCKACATDVNEAPTEPDSALKKRIQDALRLSKRCHDTFIIKDYSNQKWFASGQIDAFQAVLNWMEEAPNK